MHSNPDITQARHHPGTTSRHQGTYLPTLDGWRTIAIALVLFAHASDSLWGAFQGVSLGNTDALKKAGLLGVQLFFGLSGFLITSKLIDEESRYGKISLQAFYIRRAFRILPASLMFLVVVGILSWNGLIGISAGRWLSAFLFSANYTHADPSWYLGHFWSLAVEEHFYFLWPAAFLLLRITRRRIALSIFLALLIALWRAVDFKFRITGASAEVFWGRTDIQADGILFGVVVALMYGDPSWKSRLNRFYSVRATWPTLVLALIAIEAFPSLNWKIDFLLISLKAILIPLILLGTVLRPTAVPGHLLETAAFRWLGRLSYSLYLWQQLFLVWNEHRTPAMAWLQVFPFNLLAVFTCATLSMLLIENPLIAAGHSIAGKVPRRSITGVAPNTTRV